MTTLIPVRSNDHGKLFLFGLLLLPPTIFLVGAVPFLFFVFGFVMLRRNRDFGHLETAARNSKIYCWLFVIGFGIASIHYGSKKVEYSYERDEAVLFLMFACIAAFYILATNFLVLYPLRKHREWIEQNGIFSSRSKTELPQTDVGVFDIIKGERLRSFSVADELMKWAKLKEEGHITEEEFAEARAKLLQKS
jgi:hypothetical protein